MLGIGIITLPSRSYFICQAYLILLLLIFTAEQNKGIVLYSQRNYKQESGMSTGIPLPMFLISIYIHHSGVKSLSLISFLILSGRSARSPLQLVTRFPDHPEITTLHDNFV